MRGTTGAVLAFFCCIFGGCSFLAGAKDGAVSTATGLPAAGPPAGSGGLDVLLYTVGSAVAGALVGRYTTQRRKRDGDA